MEWRTIPGFPFHEASSQGQIRSLKLGGRVLKPQASAGGYLSMRVGKKAMSVHRLVALAFKDNPDQYLTVNHIDRKRDNNCADNLEWATAKMQAVRVHPSKINNKRGVGLYSESGVRLQWFESLVEAALATVGFAEAFKNIAMAASGKTKSAYGLFWKYEKIVDIIGEEWKPVSGTQDYEVSSMGRVRRKTRILKSWCDNSGYCVVGPKYQRKVKHKAVHRLVAEAFLPSQAGMPIVNHLDGDKTNNSLTNLEWTDYRGNANHAVASGLRKNTRSVVLVDTNGAAIGPPFPSCLSAANHYKVNVRSLNKVCKQELATCGSDRLVFRYADDVGKALAPKQHTSPKLAVQGPKRVRAVDLRDGTSIEYPSIEDAAKKCKVNIKTINSHCSGKVKNPTGKYRFESVRSLDKTS